MVDVPTRPQAPVFDRGPQYSDYVQNANLLSSDELARRNEEYKAQRAIYDTQRAEILKNYQGQLENYNKALSSYQNQLSLDESAKKAGFSSYDDYLSSRSQAIKDQQFINKYGPGTQSLINPQSRLPYAVNSQGVPVNANGAPLNVVSAFQRPGASYTLSDINKGTNEIVKNLLQGKVTGAPQQFSAENSPLSRAAYELSSASSQYRTNKAFRGQDLGIGGEAAYFATAFASGAVDLAKLDVELPGYVKNIFQNPSQLKQVPGALRQSLSDFGDLVRISPSEAIARIAGQAVYLAGPSRAINALNDFTTTQLAKLSFKYVGEGEIGKTLEFAGKEGEKLKLRVVGSIPTESISSQARKAGEEIPFAVSSQANKFFGEVRKPIKTAQGASVEEVLNSRGKLLLQKFDQGLINKKELLELDKMVKNTGAKGILERAFFADPSGNIRPSRLGIRPDEVGNFNIAQIYENFFTGDLSFSKPKPQIMVFEKINVQDFPNSLKGIASKLKTGKDLTEGEANALLDFQLRKSGQFKPVGFLTRESELTLAPGEIIRKVKTLAKTIIDGKVVPIVAADIYRAEGETLELLRKIERGRITLDQAKKLDSLLYKETGIYYDLSSKYRNLKYVNPYKLASEIGLRLRYGYSPRQNVGYYPNSVTYRPGGSLSVRLSVTSPSRTSTSGKSSGKSGGTSRDTRSGRFISPGSPGSPTPNYPKHYGGSGSPNYPGSPGNPPYSPPRSPPGYPPPGDNDQPLKYTTKKTRLEKKQLGYFILVKQNGRFVKMPGLPLSKTDAKDRLAFILDNRIVRTAKIKPITTKVLGGINEREKGAYAATAKNLREYKIRRGRKIATPNTFIEKGRAAISTPGEKRDLAEARSRKRGYQQNKKSVGINKVSFVTKDGKRVSFNSRR